MTMQPGVYYIGDLGYVMHSEWCEFCSLTISGNSCLDGEFSLKDGRKFASFCTAHGDGVYLTNTGERLSVDAGLIGCILLSDIDMTNMLNNVSSGMVYEFTEPFECTCGRGVAGWDGVIEFSNSEESVRVTTDFEDAEDEYCDEE